MRGKPKVERAVQYVRGNFFAGEHFTGLSDAQARAEAWCRDVAGMRIHGTIAARPAEVFADCEAAALLPPPAERYDVPVFTRVKVHRDFHVEVARSLYSAPKEYLGCHLDARADSALVKLYCRGQLVKIHPRQQPGRRSAAMTALVAGVAGTAAAYAGALPDQVQEVAHVMVGAPAPHHGGPQRPAVPAPRPDTQPVLRPASQPGPGQSHAGETAKAPGQTRSPRSGHGSAKGGHGTARCCAHNPPPGQNKPGRRPDDPGKPTPSATCCPAA
jgi:hypothetical protein